VQSVTHFNVDRALPTETGVLDNHTRFGAAHPEFVSLPKYFKQQGTPVCLGKIFTRH
jgi:hypothetical protein